MTLHNENSFSVWNIFKCCKTHIGVRNYLNQVISNTIFQEYVNSCKSLNFFPHTSMFKEWANWIKTDKLLLGLTNRGGIGSRGYADIPKPKLPWCPWMHPCFHKITVLEA